MRPSTRAVSIIMLAALAGLSACKREQPVDALDENAMVDGPTENFEVPNETAEAPPPVAEPVNMTNAVAPPPAFTDKEQMRDDADATGLTSRLPAEDAGQETASENESQPAK